MKWFERGRNCLWIPPDAEATGVGQPPPAILFLHGVGERGRGDSELPLVANWGLPKLRANRRPPTDGPFPFLVTAPQCPPDRTWLDEDVRAGLDLLLDEITGAGAADPARLCVAGFSMGGIGAYGLALHRPWRFAALVSVCGACPSPERLKELAHLPQWVAWAEDDEIAYLTEGSRAIAACFAHHGSLVARPFRLGPAGAVGAHARTADAAFAEPELYRWLVARPGTAATNGGTHRHQLESEDAGDDQADAGEAQRGGQLAEQHYAENGGTDRADAGPDGVSGSDRQRLQRYAEHPQADDYRHNGEHRRP